MAAGCNSFNNTCRGEDWATSDFRATVANHAAPEGFEMPTPESVSVVVTCYNLERYIGAAIESVIAQDYCGIIEIIVVDDCSTDSSLEVVRRYPRADIVPLARNGGVLNATLAGIRRCSHDIVMLLDGDDIWDSNKISEAAAAFAKDPIVAFVTHDVRYIDGDGSPLKRQSRVEAKFRNVEEGACSDLLREGILLHCDYVWLGSALSFRKSRCEFGGFLQFCDALPDAENTYQDWPLAFWIASIPGTRMAIVKKAIFSYRVHGQNHSGDASTVVKALRNSRRSLCTSLAMKSIAEYRQLEMPIRKNADRLVRYYEFMHFGYSGLRARAIMSFILAAPFVVREGHFLKEILRLFSLVLLSPQRTVDLVNAMRGRFRSVS
jgi:glycosyltransferase involved in cell wall biosynthesis